jgi:diaminohydroxyphosphoribosylaminopyrimidine deaminase / 5-amino-6-(5-phosphoribosylamino)uracil reductase
MEPCAHEGSTPPCSEAIVRAGVARVVAGSLDPNPEAAGGFARLRAAGVETELADSLSARRQNEGWRRWVADGLPFVTYKAAVSLDGRVTVPGERWVSGEASRRLVHQLRAASDAVAVGMGTVRADAPRLDARDVEVVRQPRRLAFGRGPLPPGSELELRTGPLEDELRSLAAEGVQTLLLEGGPTLATAFLGAGLVDKLLLFVAPVLSGEGPSFLDRFEGPIRPLHAEWRQVGEDVLLEAYLREP